MAQDFPYKAGGLAKRLNIHANTVRTWADTYKHLMSTEATASKRKFSEDDALVLATIAEFRSQGMLFDDIGIALENGQRIESIPPQPTKKEIEVKQEAEVMLKSEHDAIIQGYKLESQKALQRVESIESELTELKTERDRAIERWQGDTTDLNEKIQGLERELGEARGQLKVMEVERKSADYWLRVIVLIIGITVFFSIAVGVLLSNGG